MNILIIQGHPDPESYNRALGEAYAKGARQSGHEVKALNISDLDFNPNLAYGYRKRSELEPDRSAQSPRRYLVVPTSRRRPPHLVGFCARTTQRTF